MPLCLCTFCIMRWVVCRCEEKFKEVKEEICEGQDAGRRKMDQTVDCRRRGEREVRGVVI